ncbi:hypothetical protein K431DRAFT_345632 [Polychaeton citri CBS 116435]|uniref:BUB protein kinase n=1 Tax=Polychaeton citri CBS 116435 TaxID=1314669 RepID=A0A9P4UR22_9PEZI|nr:hypothetical protein K431DRAFT_345632 [Polychaeton citri CBS 116435]
MAGTGDLIDFNVIEGHKENIQALPSGRSAKALAQLYSPPLLGQTPSPSSMNDAHAGERAAFEKELETADEADDPLDIYDRYLKWTLDTYPSAQATPQSQLVQLLERATRTFQNSPHYKNDARYLKFWLHYVGWYSDAPREIYSFLARHGIGEKLALYYEEFAAYLEKVGRWIQAEEIYKMGIEKEAHPAARLLRKFGEFEQRKEAHAQRPDEPSSPALPTVRPVLAAKLDPFHAMSASAGQQQQVAKSTLPKKTGRAKMQIFSDADAAEPRPGSGGPVSERESIATLAERKKENRHEAKPWVGEKLMTGKTNGGMGKIAVFKDESTESPLPFPRHLLSRSAHSHQRGRNPNTGREECVFVNLEAIYPSRRSEYSLEELIAGRRRACRRDWSRERSTKPAEQRHPTVQHDDRAHRDSQDEVDHTDQVEAQYEQEMISEAPERKQGFRIFQDTPIEVPDDQQFGRHVSEERVESQSKSKPKQRAFEIYEDKTVDKVRIETQVKTLALNDENDENQAPSQEQMALAKQLRREARQNRTRKIKVMDVHHINNETKTIQLNMDSPVKSKVKRKKSGVAAEPTMTITTKEAMDEIYDIFNEPIESQADSDSEEEEDSDDDYTTDAESTATGKLSVHGSEYGEETRNEILQSQDEHGEAEDDGADHEDATGWSEFTMSKPAPSKLRDSTTEHDSGTGGSWDLNHEQESREDVSEGAITPVDERLQPCFVPVPPEGYEAPVGQYRDPSVLANNRLPFMTPIVEQTETSLGATTAARRAESDYYNTVKTPSRKTGGTLPSLEDTIDDEEPCSSPFQEESLDLAAEKRKVLMPIRTKSTKGTLSLGKGSAKSQIAAKDPIATLSAAEAQQQNGPLIMDLQCNPMDPSVRMAIISQMQPPLTIYDGYHDFTDTTSGRGNEIRKYIAKMSKAKGGGGEKTASTLLLPPTVDLDGADGAYSIKRELGAGTFAPVYLIENTAAITREVEDNDREQPASQGVGKTTRRRPLEAIKMEDPPNAWEFYILRQSHRRLGDSRAAASIVRAHEMHLFRDECFLVEEYRDQGTLLDLVNIAKADHISGGVDEVLAMWLSVELLRTVESMHSKQLIHGDLKADNILVRFDDPSAETDWNATYFPSGAHGWSSKGVCLIDFGRGIDMNHFVPNVGFIADWKTTDADCAEMRELRPWTYQIDYHGLAGIIHTLLFGKYMETIAEKSGSLGQGATKTYRIRESLKRYWQTEIWAEVFALLLNPLGHLEDEMGRKMPVCKGMSVVRERMESWLEENCERGLGLKGMISRMEVMIRERRRRAGKPTAC